MKFFFFLQRQLLHNPYAHKSDKYDKPLTQDWPQLTNSRGSPPANTT
jgi:hypothetical protein